MRALFCRWPSPRSPFSPGYLLLVAAAAREASSIALPADMPWVLNDGFCVTGGLCSFATCCCGGACCCCGGACGCGTGVCAACCGGAGGAGCGAGGLGRPARDA